MIELKIKYISNAVDGRLICGSEDACIHGVSTDSRTIKNGELFFALKGPNFDGHKFVDDVLKKGAAGAVVSTEVRSQKSGVRSYDSQSGIIQVEDTLTALGNLARYWRERHPVPLIAVSGTCGKTTTKEMIAAILKTSRAIVKTEGNLNNLIGLPLTLFGLNNIHKAAVVELGISEKGEMKRLAHICRPDVAVLTNIGEAHTAALKSLDGVASAKGELFQEMDASGTAIVNMDDPRLANMAGNIKAKKITFSVKSKADVMLRESKSQRVKESDISATFLAMGQEIPVRLNYAGQHNLSNAAAAIAAAITLGATKEEIQKGLASVVPLHGRMEIIALQNGITILDDTYNANPSSMEAAIETLANMNGRKIAVLGDMLEIGDISHAAHKYIGGLAHEMGIDMFFVIGNFSEDFISGATEAGMTADKIYKAKDKVGLVETLHGIMREGDNILIKGSRAMKMEEVVEKLMSNVKAQTKFKCQNPNVKFEL